MWDLPRAVLGGSCGWTSKTVWVVIKWVDNVKVFVTVLVMNTAGTRKSFVTGPTRTTSGAGTGSGESPESSQLDLVGFQQKKLTDLRRLCPSPSSLMAAQGN